MTQAKFVKDIMDRMNTVINPDLKKKVDISQVL